MAKIYIFAIGGTGARVLRSLTMLMAAGIPGIDNNTDICPLIIDYDLQNGDKDRTITSMQKYEEIRECLTKSQKDVTGFFEGKITCLDFLKKYSWFFNVKNEEQKFCDYIGYEGLKKKAIRTQQLLDSLYDTSNDDEYSELQINMKVGFQGNPNIGSVVFDRLKESKEFKAFCEKFNDKKDKIVVIGSVFGGTGSSGIPKIISAIKDEGTPANVRKAKVAAIMVMPYFKVGKSEKEISIKSEIFNSKTKAALGYYDAPGPEIPTIDGNHSFSLNDKFDRIYYVGVDSPLSIVQPNLGSKCQKNNAHIVELISAMAIAHYASKNSGNRKKYKFNASDNISDGITLENFVGKEPYQDEFVKQVIYNLINFTFAAKYFNKEIIKNNCSHLKEARFCQDLNLIPSETRPENLRTFCDAFNNFYCETLNDSSASDDGFIQWLKELHSISHGAHRLKIFNTESIDNDRLSYIVTNYPIVDGNNKGILDRNDGKDDFTSEMTNSYTNDDGITKEYQNLFNQGEMALPWILSKILNEASKSFTNVIFSKIK